jgi:hypothetical protein
MYPRFVFELLLQLIHLKEDFDRPFEEKVLHNFVLLTKIVLVILFSADAIYFYQNYPADGLRFARYFRPCKSYWHH